MNTPTHQAHGHQQQQTLNRQRVTQDVLRQQLARLQGLGHAQRDQLGAGRLPGCAGAVHQHVAQAGQAHRLAAQQSVFKTHQRKKLHLLRQRHRRRQVRVTGQGTALLVLNFVKQARADVVFKQVTRRPQHVHAQALVFQPYLFSQRSRSQVQRAVISLVGRLHSAPVGHISTHPDEHKQRQQNQQQQALAQRVHGWRGLVMTLMPCLCR